METGRWIVGVDLGQGRDFTTLAVLELAITRDVEVLVIE